MRFSVRVQPRASRSEVAGLYGDALKVRLIAPPVDGRANAELVALIAERLGVAVRAVRIVAGEGARTKLLEVDGVDAGRVRALVGSIT